MLIRTLSQYSAFSTCPYALVFIAYLAQFTEKRFREENAEAMRILRKAWKVLNAEPSINGIKFIQLDVEKMDIVVCIDAAFAVNKDHSSQLGVLILLRETDSGKTNVVHFSSTKSKEFAKAYSAPSCLLWLTVSIPLWQSRILLFE